MTMVKDLGKPAPLREVVSFKTGMRFCEYTLSCGHTEERKITKTVPSRMRCTMCLRQRQILR